MKILSGVAFFVGVFMVVLAFQLGGTHPASAWLFVFGCVLFGTVWTMRLDSMAEKTDAE
jgi:hypothetical protein